MATNPDNAGIPTVSPTENVPVPIQRLTPPKPPEAGMAKVSMFPAQAVQEAGSELMGAGRQFTQASEHWGEIAADDVSNQFQDQANKLLHGDPNTPITNPDGSTSPDLGYLGKKGAAALDARAETEQKLDGLLKKARGTLLSADQRLRFDNFSRRYRAVVSSQIGTHADTQGNTYALDVAQGEVKSNLDTIASNANDPALVKSAGAGVINAFTKIAQIKGARPGDEMWKQAQAEGLKQAAKSQVLAISATDPLRAQRMIENYKGALGQDYHVLADHVRNRADEAVADDFSNRVISDATGATAPPQGGVFTAAQVNDAIVGGESGGRQFNASGGVLTSDKGAAGLGQITAGTWRQYARPGERIENAADNKRVSQRITDDLYQRYGGDWQRVAVGYFSGPGNVSPPGSLVPWVNNTNDGHSTVAQYVADKAQRLGVIDPIAARAKAHEAVETSNMTNKQKDLTNRNVDRRYHSSEVASLADAKAKKDANDTASNEYVTQMLTTPDMAMRQKIANDPRLEAHTKLALDDALQKHLKGDVEQASQVYGDGFWEARKRVLLAPGDPNRLSDPTEILRMAGPGGSLTLSGAKELMQTNSATQKSVNDNMVQQTQQHIMKYAEKRFGIEEGSAMPGFPGLKNPAGEKLFNGKFVPTYLAAYDAWTKAGKNPWEFLTQEKADEIADQIYPRRQMEKDKLNAAGEAPATAREPIPPTPEGINADTWSTVVGQPPIVANGQEIPITKWAGAVDYLRTHPTPEVIDAFDRKYGAGGYSAKNILERLQKPVAPTSGLPAETENPLSSAAPAEAAAATPAKVSKENMMAADTAMKLTPQEKSLYNHHLDNLGAGGVQNADGTTSSLLATTIEVGGKTYVIPTVWDNKIVPVDDAVARARKRGFDKFPSYPNQAAAEARYKMLHDFMERDTTARGR